MEEDNKSFIQCNDRYCIDVPEENHGVRPEDTPDPHKVEIKNLDALAIDTIYELSRRVEKLEGEISTITNSFNDVLYDLKALSKDFWHHKAIYHNYEE